MKEQPFHAKNVLKILILWFCLWAVMIGLILLFLIQIEPQTPSQETPIWDPGKQLYFDKDWNFSESSQSNGQYRVVWMAPFYSYSGYGTEAISFVTGLRRLIQEKLVIIHFGDTFQKNIEKEFSDSVREDLKQMRQVTPQVVHRFPIVSICHSTPPSWGKECPIPNSGLKIGRTMFETDLVPSQWIRKINMMDQVWVPTKFHIESFARAGVFRKKLVAVPEAVDTDFFDPACYVRNRVGIYGDFRDNFVFVSVFKWEERKGWKSLIRGYLREFNRREKVLLFIVTRKTEHKQDPLREIDKLRFEAVTEGYRIEHLPKIVVRTTRIEESTLPILYKNADAFVLASKGEGWGRPLVEAMCMELPAIHTFWSGPTEFMTPENSFPLNVSSFARVDESAGPGTKGHVWAEPSIPHLRQLMRYVYSHPEERLERGKQARRDIVAKYAIDIVAELVHKQIISGIQNQVNTSRKKP